MNKPSITYVTLDDRAIAKRSEEVNREYHATVADLLAANNFTLQGKDYPPPYSMALATQEQRIQFRLTSSAEKNTPWEQEILVPSSPFRRIIRDYFFICDSYYKAMKQRQSTQIETIDMARRGLHNEGSELLQNLMENQATMDFHTARRLFTLICVLHMR